MYYLGKTSRKRLHGLHPDGIVLVATAIQITEVDFGVSQTLRTKAEQRRNIRNGVSWTMDSYHLKQSTGYAHAWDVFAAINGQARYDWPLMWKIYDAFTEASERTRIPFEAGILWRGRKQDGPHYQLPRRTYGR